MWQLTGRRLQPAVRLRVVNSLVADSKNVWIVSLNRVLRFRVSRRTLAVVATLQTPTARNVSSTLEALWILDTSSALLTRIYDP